MVLSNRLGLRRSRLYRVARRVEVLGGRRTPSLLLGLVVTFYKLVDVDVEFEELLPNEVLNKLIVINKLLVVDLGPALQLHFFGIVLPLNLDLNQSAAD